MKKLIYSNKSNENKDLNNTLNEYPNVCKDESKQIYNIASRSEWSV